ncbi:MAG: hypothetical protein ABL932_11645 [Terricaulis sp.]
MAGKADQQPASSTLKAALDACRRHIGFVILFSACLNLLYLAPSIDARISDAGPGRELGRARLLGRNARAAAARDGAAA